MDQLELKTLLLDQHQFDRLECFITSPNGWDGQEGIPAARQTVAHTLQIMQRLKSEGIVDYAMTMDCDGIIELSVADRDTDVTLYIRRNGNVDHIILNTDDAHYMGDNDIKFMVTRKAPEVPDVIIQEMKRVLRSDDHGDQENRNTAH